MQAGFMQESFEQTPFVPDPHSTPSFYRQTRVGKPEMDLCHSRKHALFHHHRSESPVSVLSTERSADELKHFVVQPHVMFSQLGWPKAKLPTLIRLQLFPAILPTPFCAQHSPLFRVELS